MRYNVLESSSNQANEIQNSIWEGNVVPKCKNLASRAYSDIILIRDNLIKKKSYGGSIVPKMRSQGGNNFTCFSNLSWSLDLLVCLAIRFTNRWRQICIFFGRVKNCILHTKEEVKTIILSNALGNLKRPFF